MSAPVASGLTYDDLSDLPQDDGLRRELTDGRYVDVYRRGGDGHYGAPTTLGRGEVLTCLAAPGFELLVDRALGG